LTPPASDKGLDCGKDIKVCGMVVIVYFSTINLIIYRGVYSFGRLDGHYKRGQYEI